MKKWIAMTMLALFSVAAFAQNNTKETAPAAKEIKGTVFEKGTLKELLAKAAKEKKYLFVDVYATWCGPCKAMHPVLEELDLEEDFKVGQVDIDEYPELVSKYRIMSVPFFIVFKNGEVAGKTIGVQSKEELLALIRG